MNKLIIIPIIFVIAVAVTVYFNYTLEESSESQSPTIYDAGFTYYDIEIIQTTLAEQNILVSTPAAITDHTIKQYCPFFADGNTQRSVEYCTTTALLDSDGEPLGNINMGGTIDGPIMALAIIDASPFLDSRENEVDFVFQTMIETLVCDCWEEKQPGGFESVSAWLTTAKEKYVEFSKPTLTSNIASLDNMRLILEITTKDESYLWTLIVLK